MNFEAILDQAIAMLQRRGRVTYRTLKRQFQLDDDVLEDLKEELIYGQRLAADEDANLPENKSGVSSAEGTLKSYRAVSRASLRCATAFSPSMPRSAGACNFLNNARIFALAGFMCMSWRGVFHVHRREAIVEEASRFKR